MWLCHCTQSSVFLLLPRRFFTLWPTSTWVKFPFPKKQRILVQGLEWQSVCSVCSLHIPGSVPSSWIVPLSVPGLTAECRDQSNTWAQVCVPRILSPNRPHLFGFSLGHEPYICSKLLYCLILPWSSFSLSAAFCLAYTAQSSLLETQTGAISAMGCHDLCAHESWRPQNQDSEKGHSGSVLGITARN